VASNSTLHPAQVGQTARVHLSGEFWLGFPQKKKLCQKSNEEKRTYEDQKKKGNIFPLKMGAVYSLCVFVVRMDCVKYQKINPFHWHTDWHNNQLEENPKNCVQCLSTFDFSQPKIMENWKPKFNLNFDV